MSSSTPSHKFLIDENVRIELFRFLQKKGFDSKLTPKAGSDSKLLAISKAEKRIIVTNDYDFTEASTEEAFAVVWLRIPQKDQQALITSFEKLLTEIKDFSEKLVVLKPNSWDEFPLMEELKI